MTLTANDLESPFFLGHGRDPLEGCSRLLRPGSIRYLGDDKGLILYTKLHKLWSVHVKSLQESRLLKTEKVERNKNFKSHNLKVGQLIAVTNHLRNTFQSKFVSDYKMLKIVNKYTLLIESLNGRTCQTNINDAKPVSVSTINDNTLHEFKQSALRKEHIHLYKLQSSSM